MPVVDVTGSIYLSVGEGATADSIIIMTAGAGNGTWLSKQSAFVYTTPKPSDPTTFLTLTLNISGSDANDLWDQYRALQLKLYQARQSQGPYGHGQNVTLGVQLFQANLSVFFDVVDGKIDLPQGMTEYLPVTFVENAVLTLEVLPYPHGTAVTYSASGTISAGVTPTYFKAALPGDMPGYGTLTLDDVGGTVAPINGWIVGQRTVPGGWNTAGTLVTAAALMGTAGIGVGTTDSSWYAGTIYVTSVPDQDWQTFASVYQPSGSLNYGLFDVYAKVRDNAVQLEPPANLTAVSRGIFSTTQLIDGRPVLTYAAAATVNLRMRRPATQGNTLVLVVGGSGAPASPTLPSGFAIDANSADAGPTWRVTIATYPDLPDGYFGPNGDGLIPVTMTGATAIRGYVDEWWGLTIAPQDRAAVGSGTTSTVLNSGQANELVIGAAVGSAWPGPSQALTASSGSVQTILVGGDASGVSLGFIMGRSDTSGVTFTNTVTSQRTALSTYKGYNTSVGSFASGKTYTFWVSAFDAVGNESPACPSVDLVMDHSGAVTLFWDAPLSGATPAGYRIYWTDGSGTTYYVNYSSTTAPSSAPAGFGVLTQTLSSPTTGATGTPVFSDTPAASLRYRVGLNDGAVMYEGPPYSPQVANGAWEPLYLGTHAHPPQLASDTSGTIAPRSWFADLQVMHDGNPARVDVDYVTWIPHLQQQLQAFYNDGGGTAMNIATAYKWKIETRRDGRALVTLLDRGTGSEKGQVNPVGNLTLGPGDTTLIFIPFGNGGVANHSQFTAQLTYTPRYKLFAGSNT